MTDFQISPLDIALTHGHTEFAELLIQHEASLDFKQVFRLAIYLQEPEYVKILAESYKNEFMNDSKKDFVIQDIFLRSVRKGNLEIIDHILDINGLKKSCFFPIAKSKNKEVAKFLIDRGANINNAKNNGGSHKCEPLINVFYSKDIYDNSFVEVMQVLLDSGASANARNCYGQTALMTAVIQEGSGSVLQLLVDHDAEFGERDKDGNTAVMYAALGRCSQSVSPLLQFIKDKKQILNIQNNQGLTALMCAMASGKTFIVKELIDHGADVNIKDTNEKTALLYLLHISEKHEDEILRSLIQAGCDVNCQNNKGNSPLMLAAKKYFKDTLRVLFDSGAEINSVSKINKTKTALIHLLYTSKRDLDYFSCLEFLLERGACLSYSEVLTSKKFVVKPCFYPLAESKNKVVKFLIDRDAHLSNTKKKEGICKCIPLITMFICNDIYESSCVDIMQVLLDISANSRSCFGETALMLTVSVDNCGSVLRFLLDHGAELGDRNVTGETALMYAVGEECSQNVSLLLQFIKDKKQILNKQSNDGFTALMYAMTSGNTFIVKELIDHGADVNIKDTDENTALLHLLFTSHKHKDEILRSLIQAGCDVNYQNSEGISPLMLAAQKYLKDTLCVLLVSGAEVNSTSETDKTKTALTHLRYKSKRDLEYFSCLEFLLDRGACSSYLEVFTFHNIIVSYQAQVVPKLIRCGFGPAKIKIHGIRSFTHVTTLIMTSCSSLRTALYAGNSTLAHFFIEIRFLTHCDTFLLGHDNMLRQYLERENLEECLDILNEISTQPMTLFNLSFVAVSTAVGTNLDREVRVNDLPLPQIIKEKLLFRSPDVLLTVPEKYDGGREHCSGVLKNVRYEDIFSDSNGDHSNENEYDRSDDNDDVHSYHNCDVKFEDNDSDDTHSDGDGDDDDGVDDDDDDDEYDVDDDDDDKDVHSDDNDDAHSNDGGDGYSNVDGGDSQSVQQQTSWIMLYLTNG